MKTLPTILIQVILLILFNQESYAQNTLPQLFLFLGGDKASTYEDKLNNTCVTGVQIIYSWKQLEPEKDVYDFSKIKQDITDLKKWNKKLFIQIQDRSFEPTVLYVPDYIREDAIYHGGVAMQYDYPGDGKPITTGWVARVWDVAVRERFQLLIKKLAAEFDGEIYGINLPETAVDFDENNPPQGYSHDNYFHAELDNIAYVRNVFHKSIVVQYINFFPGEWDNDHRYMSRLFSYAVTHGIGLGGPDVVPNKDSHMHNSYPFFHKLKDKLFVSMAIQEPDYTYKNPESGEPYTFNDFYHFNKNYLGANIIFWNKQEPFYTNQLSSKLNSTYFECHA